MIYNGGIHVILLREFRHYTIPPFLTKLEKLYNIPPAWARLPFEITDDLTISSILPKQIFGHVNFFIVLLFQLKCQCWWFTDEESTHKKIDNETGPTPGKLHPFALQLSSVPTYISFSRQLPKLPSTKIVISFLFCQNYYH